MACGRGSSPSLDFSGQSYEDFLPLKLSDTSYDHNSDTLAVGYADGYTAIQATFIDISIPYAAGALFSTVEDLFTWNQSLSTEQLVPKKDLDEMFSPQASIGQAGELAYGYGWGMGKERGHPYFEHTGTITYYPEDQVTIIILSNQDNSNVGLIRDVLSKKILGDE